MKVKTTILSMYQTQISIHSVISISLTQKISDIKLVRGRCRDIAFLLMKIQIYTVQTRIRKMASTGKSQFVNVQD